MKDLDIKVLCGLEERNLLAPSLLICKVGVIIFS